MPGIESQGPSASFGSVTKPFDAVAFVEEHGVVLASARGPVPSLAEAIVGAPIRGSWWSQPKGNIIFDALTAVDDSPDILCFKLVDAKLTFVHRRLWPALVRLASDLRRGALAVIKQEHTASGKHRNVTTNFPDWVDAKTNAASQRLTVDQAQKLLGARCRKPTKRVTKRRTAK